MLLGGNEETKLIDNYAINNLKIPSIVLMENAAISFVKNINLSFSNYLIICGKGNNGGDGFAIARQLHSLNKNVTIFVVDDKNMSQDCQINYNICLNLNINIVVGEIEKLNNLMAKSECIIDSIFGTGLNSNVTGVYAEIINKINLYSPTKKIYSVDIPSGIDGNTGNILGVAVKANKTISFVTYKKAFLNMENIEYFGDIVIENIGLNIKNVDRLVYNYYLDNKEIKSYEKKRNPISHKGDFGKALIFAGSRGLSGASTLVSNACVRTGIGLITLITYDDSSKSSLLPEVMSLNITDQNIQKLEEQVLNSDVIAIGPGIGKTAEALMLLEKILSYQTNNKGNIIKFVIDADGINLIAENKSLLLLIKGRAILTPHLIEFSRISGCDLNDISSNNNINKIKVDILNDINTRLELAQKFAKENNIVLLLKGKNTIITDGNKSYVNSTGNSHMANGGMGDTLTGIITALVGQNYNLIESANIGAYLHGLIGDDLLETQYIINPTHIIDNIPKYLKKIFK